MTDQSGVGAPDGLARIWTPHRMAYVRSDTTADGCPFCRIPQGDDAEGLVVARGRSTYAVLNLHPYNPGHLMVLPYRHVAELEELTADESADLMAMTQQAIRTIRGVSNPQAFNVGLNLGGPAGGSLADHLHQHVVPRWSGDANFITVIGATKTLPQLLADTRQLLADAWR
ncbi:HIT family protein [Nocardioides piscis]|uniref:HIT domain-containing protein n=1 Tax=Nocardioides piscis TaxID=2714938 RepID=A0A6G7YJ51_9ACTN|nr:HIT domain-containing protein [Nocardioides piscis]QIK76773.1 HIT domain-containing protein [Nocardioides piscis]